MSDELKRAIENYLIAVGNLTNARSRLEQEISKVENEASEPLLAKPKTILGLSARGRHALNRLRCSTVGDVVKVTVEEFLTPSGNGLRVLREVREKLAKFNLRLADDDFEGA